MNKIYANRVFGLDVMRCMALVFVLLIHSEFFLRRNFNPDFIRHIPDGVELFFMLSGYLIGRLIIQEFIVAPSFNWRILANFVQRRLFRTLPNYYLLLAINVLLIFLGWIPGYINKFLITYPFFMQNFFKPYDFLFWESWSLSVEEWFYFLFPSSLFIGLTFLKKWSKKKVMLFCILSFLILPTLFRLYAYDVELDRDLFFRKLVITRFDACIYGILMAYLMHYHRTIFQSKTINFLLFLVGAVTFFYFNRQSGSEFYNKTIYFNTQGLSLMLWAPFLIQLTVTSTKLKHAIAHLSLISYAIYLIHLPIIHIFNYFLPRIDTTQMILVYIFYWILNLFIGHLIFKYFERPIMLKREHWTKKLMHKKMPH